MNQDLERLLKETRTDLLNLKAGSVTKAQRLIKTLRIADRKLEAKNLVELMNKQAKDIERKNW